MSPVCKEPEKIGAGFLFCCGEEVLLLYRHSKHNDKTWGLPGGNREDGEELQQVAHRESMEELGQLPDSYHVKGHVLTKRGKHDQKHYTVFVAEVPPDVRASYLPQLNEEHTAWRWFPLPVLHNAAATAVVPPGAAGTGTAVELHPVVKKLLHGNCWQQLESLLSYGGKPRVS